MNSSRRKFLKSGASLAGLPLIPSLALAEPAAEFPVVVSTWNNRKANEAAWKILQSNGYALDAVEQGARVPEADPKDNSVGFGGLPDREGAVTLDACIMNEKSDCGAVVFVQGYKHVISLARLVMEKTPHVLLAGKGAQQFAEAQGFKRENLLTKEAEAAWRAWLKESKYSPNMNVFKLGNHDTIGILALDRQQRLCGACSTSGMAYKMHGRVGDSPIVGAGLFVDGEVGAATATGVGEEMIRIAGSHTIVELMRHGRSTQQACEEAIARVVKKNGDERAKKLSVAFLALSKEGEVGSFSTVGNFEYVLTTASRQHLLIKSKSYFE